MSKRRYISGLCALRRSIGLSGWPLLGALEAFYVKLPSHQGRDPSKWPNPLALAEPDAKLGGMAREEKHDTDASARVPSMFAGYGPGQRRGSGRAAHRSALPAKPVRRAESPFPKPANKKSSKGKLAPYLTLTAFLLALEGLVLAPVVLLGINSLIDTVVALYNSI